MAKHRSYETYKTYCQIRVRSKHSALLDPPGQLSSDRQLKALEEQFLQDGGFTERLYKKRQEARGRDWDK